MIEQLKKHWFVEIVLVIAVVAGATWKISDALFVRPRDFKIKELERQLAMKRSELEAPQPSATRATAFSEKVAVREGESVTSSDGGCNVKLQGIEHDRAMLTLSLDAEKPWMFEADRGTRWRMGLYSVDVVGFKGGIASLVISRMPKPRQ